MLISNLISGKDSKIIDPLVFLEKTEKLEEDMIDNMDYINTNFSDSLELIIKIWYILNSS